MDEGARKWRLSEERMRRSELTGVVLFAVAAAVVIAASAGGAGTAADADGLSAGLQASTAALKLAALPAGNVVSGFAFDPRRPSVVYVTSPHAAHMLAAASTCTRRPMAGGAGSRRRLTGRGG
jgi:hypothetical protein